jgi:tetratricopeptide (TPR) repeat protein
MAVKLREGFIIVIAAPHRRVIMALYMRGSMKKVKNLVIAVAAVALLSSCSAMLVPATSDPGKKIENAYILFDEQQRPLPAEQLIKESVDTYKQENNEMGLAEAYRAYGFFFRSSAVEKWRKHYETDGFLDKTATYSNRYDKSIEYFDQSARLFAKNGKYDKVTNVYLKMGFTYEFAGRNEKACESYTASLDTNARFAKDNPGASLTLPKGFSGTYEDYINGFLKRLDCKKGITR